MSVPVRVPVAVGVNVTITVQLAGEGPNELVQVPRVSAKSPVVPNEIDVDPVPVFFIVTVLDALVVPTACLANVSLVGVAVTTTVRAFPVPLRLTICGEVDPLSLTEIDPARVPVACGVNVTEIVQVAGEGPSVVPHVFVCAKSPLAGAIEIGVDAVPVFFTVTVFAALVVPTVCAANVSLVGETVTTTVPALPVPVRLTVCGELLAWSVIKIEPVSDDFTKLTIAYGFMESPNLPKALALCRKQGLKFDIMATSFFLGRRSVVPAAQSGMPLWQDKLFIFLMKNATNPTDFFNIPPGRVVELGTQVTV